MILLIDNYDSFVYNLARYFVELGQEVDVRRNDAITVDEVRGLAPAAIVLSPGPGRPEEAGICVSLIQALGETVPMLGVCLGHQAIGVAFGASVRRSGRPRHGVSSEVHHDCEGIFSGLPSPLVVGRYHSLVIDPSTVPANLHVCARSRDGVDDTVMAIRHRVHRLVGVQFHPESILTARGHDLLENFLRLVPSHPEAATGVSRPIHDSAPRKLCREAP